MRLELETSVLLLQLYATDGFICKKLNGFLSCCYNFFYKGISLVRMPPAMFFIPHFTNRLRGLPLFIFVDKNLFSQTWNAGWTRDFPARQDALTWEYFMYFREKQHSMAPLPSGSISEYRFLIA